MSRDRFEAMVAKEIELAFGYSSTEISPSQVVKLLRRDHVALVRAVKRLRKPKNFYDFDIAYNYGISDVLALLAARKGRT